MNDRHQVNLDDVLTRDARPDESEQSTLISLADENRATLGFFPRQAFEEQILAGRVIAAIGSKSEVLGYCMYRTSNERASIAHMCVGERHRRRGIARILLNALRRRVSEYRYIEARCRRDFAAHNAWQALGFAAECEIQGRGKDAKPITVFRYDLGHQDLFSPPPPDTERLRCALDASVLIKMQDGDPECSSLLADWVTGALEFVVTAEIRNDFLNADAVTRKRRESYATSFAEVRSSPDDFEKARAIASTVFPSSSKKDAHQIARASAAGVGVFLTTDEELISKSLTILERLGVRVMHPAGVIAELDSLESAAAYSPSRLAGTLIKVARARPSDEIDLNQHLRYGAEGERSSLFARILRTHLEAGDESDVLVVRDKATGPLIGFIAGRRATNDIYRVSALRVPPGKTSNRGIMRALARQLCFLTIDCAIKKGCSATVIDDKYIHRSLKAALLAEHFSSENGISVRVHPSGVYSRAEALSAFPVHAGQGGQAGLSQALGRIRAVTSEKLGEGTPSADAWVEQTLWPLKLINSALPTYIVPIQPRWAEHLFDDALAANSLFGADTHLGLAREAVYYRSHRGTRITAPARILWYVSSSRTHPGGKSIRASSILTRARIDTAHKLYQRLKRLGVWQWNDVLQAAKGEPHGILMALEFGSTELLSTPVPFTEAQSLLGTKSTFQGPLSVDTSAMFSLYQRCFAR